MSKQPIYVSYNLAYQCNFNGKQQNPAGLSHACRELVRLIPHYIAITPYNLITGYRTILLYSRFKSTTQQRKGPANAVKKASATNAKNPA